MRSPDHHNATRNLDEEETSLLQPTRVMPASGYPSTPSGLPSPAPQPAAAPPAHAPVAAGLRTVIALVLSLLSVLCALGATGGAWVRANIASETGFSEISANLASDQQLATRIADGAVEDLMKSEAMTTFLDGTKASGLYSILVKPTEDGIRSMLNRAAGELSKTDEYRSLWRDIAEETRRDKLGHDGAPGPEQST